MFPHNFSHLVEQRLVRRIELLAIALQFLQAYSGGIIALVGDVVGATREAVNDLDGPAQRLRQEQRRDREVFVMSDRHGDPDSKGRTKFESSSEGIIRCFIRLFVSALAHRRARRRWRNW